MANVRVAVLRTAGTNCDFETVHAWELAGAKADRVHLRELADAPQQLNNYQILTLPGGFSFGDDISAGKVFATRLQRLLRDPIRTFVAAGKLVLGICNGFQVLVKAGLLQVASDQTPALTQAGVSITANQPHGFQCRWVTMHSASERCAFLEPRRHYQLPIAHGEGRVVFDTPATALAAERRGQFALRYTDHGLFPANPNGSTAELAGLCDETGRVFGLMPHPERFVRATQHPAWTIQHIALADGLRIFQHAVAHFA